MVILGGIFTLYLFRGEAIWVNYHDQLDSEVLYYMLRSENSNTLFRTTFENFMSGKAYVQPATVFQGILYYFLKPIYAFITNMFIVRIVAYLGMYLLLRKLNVEEVICFSTGMLFSLLPIYSVYGLCSMGVPLLIVCFWNLYKGEWLGRSSVYIFLYALYSSLILIGFAIIAIVFVIMLAVWKKEKQGELVCSWFL